LLGAGTGAIIGNELGNTGAGTAIGAGLGALAGSAIGDSMDQMEAQNRALIAQQLGREIRAGAVTSDDVVMMSQSRVDDELIINHIRHNGMATVPDANDLVRLTQLGVSANVIKVMQEPPPPPRQETVVIERPVPRPVVIEEHVYGPPCYHPPRYYVPRRHARSSHLHWGFSFH
jgi:hypothetical protein